MNSPILEAGQFSVKRACGLTMATDGRYHAIMSGQTHQQTTTPITISTWEERRAAERQSRQQIRARQFARLNELLRDTLPGNSFYAPRVKGVALPIADDGALRRIPFTTKAELQQPGCFPELEITAAANHTYPLTAYARFHQTSGTKGRPLVVMDTAEGWHAWIDSWQYVLDAAEVKPTDRVFLAFSFGPFVGFWSAFDAATARGCLAIPGGGLSSEARLNMILETRATVLCCTPSYALHLAEVAASNSIDLTESNVRVIIVAGEPGGSLPATRVKLETSWGAMILDHAGASEVGAWGYGTLDGRGMYINERDFLPEFIKPGATAPIQDGDVAELVLTNLHRPGLPVVRYRTGDLVRAVAGPGKGENANNFTFLEGGVLGRVDDMLIVRGVNVYPTAIEEIIRQIPEVVEYRMTATRRVEMDELAIEIEPRKEDAAVGQRLTEQVADQLRSRLGLRVSVMVVKPGELPRFELKGRRFVDRRAE